MNNQLQPKSRRTLPINRNPSLNSRIVSDHEMTLGRLMKQEGAEIVEVEISATRNAKKRSLSKIKTLGSTSTIILTDLSMTTLL